MKFIPKGTLQIRGLLIELWADNEDNLYHKSNEGKYITLSLYLELNNLAPSTEEVLKKLIGIIKND